MDALRQADQAHFNFLRWMPLELGRRFEPVYTLLRLCGNSFRPLSRLIEAYHISPAWFPKPTLAMSDVWPFRRMWVIYEAFQPPKKSRSIKWNSNLTYDRGWSWTIMDETEVMDAERCLWNEVGGASTRRLGSPWNTNQVAVKSSAMACNVRAEVIPNVNI